MFVDIVGYCITCINAAFEWMDKIFSAIPGSFIFLLAMLGVYTVFRILLVPIFGTRLASGISDVAKKTVDSYSHTSKPSDKYNKRKTRTTSSKDD